MSEYTIINVVSDEHSLEEFKSTLELKTYSRFVRLRNESVLARFGGDKRDTIKEELIGSESGEIIYETPIELRVLETGEFLAYVIINYFEDTGNHHESELFEVRAFDEAVKIDEVRIDDDRTGEKVDEYYREQHGLITSIEPP